MLDMNGADVVVANASGRYAHVAETTHQSATVITYPEEIE